MTSNSASRSHAKAGRKMAAEAAGGRDYKSTEFGWKRRNTGLRALRRLIQLLTAPFARLADGGHRWRAWLRRWSRAQNGGHGPPRRPMPPASPAGKLPR